MKPDPQLQHVFWPGWSLMGSLDDGSWKLWRFWKIPQSWRQFPWTLHWGVELAQPHSYIYPNNSRSFAMHVQFRSESICGNSLELARKEYLESKSTVDKKRISVYANSVWFRVYANTLAPWKKACMGAWCSESENSFIDNPRFGDTRKLDCYTSFVSTVP